MPLPPNLEAIMSWVKENRKDALPYMNQLMEKTTTGPSTDQANAFLLLMTMCFAAGRTYQKEHPTLDPNYEYHR